MTGFVDLNDIRLAYGPGGDGTLALDGLTMAVKRGEFAAVVGPSGCGKSTLMKLATGLIRPQAGTVEVAGKEVDGPVSVAGMAFQNPSMLPWRTTLKNVMLPLEIVQPHRRRLKARSRKLCRARREPAGNRRAERLWRQVSLAALRRHAAARQPVPGADPRSGASHARRAFRRARRLHPRGTVAGDARSSRGKGVHGHSRHPRSARGGVPGRPGVRDERPSGPHHRRAGGRVLPRPRPIDLTYEAEFNDIVHELRGHIAEARAAE